MQTQKISYKRHRFPPQIIAHGVWLYVRFNLSLREAEKLMLERGVISVHDLSRKTWSGEQTLRCTPAIENTITPYCYFKGIRYGNP